MDLKQSFEVTTSKNQKLQTKLEAIFCLMENELINYGGEIDPDDYGEVMDFFVHDKPINWLRVFDMSYIDEINYSEEIVLGMVNSVPENEQEELLLKRAQFLRKDNKYE